MIASFRPVQKPLETMKSDPQTGPRATALSGVGQRRHVRVLFLEECPKFISPIDVVRMSSLECAELLACRSRVAPELCQEINNPALLGNLPFRDIHLSNSLNEIIHDGLSVHCPTSSP
jgi:hypothetical protein